MGSPDIALQGDASSRGEESASASADHQIHTNSLVFRGVFEGTPVGINLTDVNGVVLTTNRAFERMLGCNQAELIARTFDSITHPDDQGLDRGLFTDLLAGKREFYRIEKRYVRPDGRLVWVRLSVSLIRDEAGTPQFTVGIAEDITDRKVAEEKLRESERRFSSAFEHSPIGMALVGLDGRWLRVNRALCELVGYSEEELVSAKFQDITHPDDLDTDLFLAQRLLSGESTTYEMEKRYFHRTGQLVWVRLRVSLVSHLDGAPWYFIGQVQDITEHKRTQEALHTLLQRQAASLEAMEYASTHDSLTDLVNRSLFMDRLHHAIISARRQQTSFALLLLDLDGFKSINDSHGHGAGDRCLVEVAHRLRQVVRGTDTIARLGGDEFVILLWGADHGAAAQLADKLRTVITMPIALGRCATVLGASIGISIFPQDGNDAHTLLHKADMDMYVGKRRARQRSLKRDAGAQMLQLRQS